MNIAENLTTQYNMNAVKCLNCGKILESMFRHDFQQCRCENQTFVDGGHDYQRVGGVDLTLVAVYRDGKYINLVNGEQV